MRRCNLSLFGVGLFLLAVPMAQGQVLDDKHYFRLTNGWQKEMSLSVLIDGKENNQLILARSEDVIGQLWRFTEHGKGFYRLTNAWQNDKSLDVVNDGVGNDQLILATTTNVTGQQWRISRHGKGFIRLTNAWQKGKSLDVLNDESANNRLIMAKSGAFTGQQWKLQKTRFEVSSFNFIIWHDIQAANLRLLRGANSAQKLCEALPALWL